jgi:hypothetical protein
MKPSRFSFSVCMTTMFLGQALVHSPQPLQRSKSILIFSIVFLSFTFFIPLPGGVPPQAAGWFIAI